MYDAEFENEALVNGDLRCALRCESHRALVGKNEKSAIFPQLLLFYIGKQHDRLLIEGSKNGSLE